MRKSHWKAEACDCFLKWLSQVSVTESTLAPADQAAPGNAAHAPCQTQAPAALSQDIVDPVSELHPHASLDDIVQRCVWLHLFTYTHIIDDMCIREVTCVTQVQSISMTRACPEAQRTWNPSYLAGIDHE
jgi:hypothetical protein